MPNKKKSKVYDPVAGYALYAKEYDKSLGFLDTFEKNELVKMLGDLKGKRVLDVGCGTGRLVESLMVAGAEIVGVDFCEEMVEVARKKYPKLDFRVGDIEELPFEDESFDMVVAAFVIVHVRDLRQAFEEVYRILKPGGAFIVTNINQKKAPKLPVGKELIVINSFYHMPKKVEDDLEKAFFRIEEEQFVEDDGVWVNQIIKAVK